MLSGSLGAALDFRLWIFVLISLLATHEFWV